MKVLITGSSGMLGCALCRNLLDKFEVIGLDKEEAKNQDFSLVQFIKADISKRESTVRAIASANADIIIHTAAYTDVDGCEKNAQLAKEVNSDGTETLALGAKESNASLWYISTDFVFDGEKESAYLESDAPKPLNIYGASKLEGEKRIQSLLGKYAIIRSSWLFGKDGKNFVETILRKNTELKNIKVVDDQRGSPTYTEDLAQALKKLLSCSAQVQGIYHITNSGSCTWYEFALAINEIAGLDLEIEPISSATYGSSVRRPKTSVLENTRYQECAQDTLRHWKEALKEYLDERNAFS